MLRKRWTDDEVLEWANHYLKSDDTLLTMEHKLNVPHAMLHWCFVNRLFRIDPKLSELIIKKLTRRWSKKLK